MKELFQFIRLLPLVIRFVVQFLRVQFNSQTASVGEKLVHIRQYANKAEFRTADDHEVRLCIVLASVMASGHAFVISRVGPVKFQPSS